MKNSKRQLPYFGSRLLRAMTQQEDASSMSGDLEEVYFDLLHQKGYLKAGLWFWGQVLRSLRTVIWYSIYRSLIMFGNYLKIALRNAKRQSLYTIINITGLAVGLACCILIMLWLQDELAFDRFHDNYNEIYRVIQENRSSNESITMSTAPFAAVPSMHEEFHEIVNSTRYRSGFSNWRIKYGEKIFFNDYLGVADPSFFRIFSFNFIHGDIETALKNKNSIVITEETAIKYFGDDNPLGKILLINNDEQPVEVTGVIENIPAQSHIQFDIIFNVQNAEDWWRMDMLSWKDSRTNVYVLTQKESDLDQINTRMENYVKEHDPETSFFLSLQSLKDIHLRSVLT
ncbi:MAG: ABC transporter permease, partial [bacterium]|nr:ABC transporter permease [bacterium]